MGMKHLGILAVALAAFVVAGCFDGNRKTVLIVGESLEDTTSADSTIYGRCGLGTAMNTLELVVQGSDTIEVSLVSANDSNDVVGGLSVGDSMAVTGYMAANGCLNATKAINLTSLLGKWGSIGQTFELCEGGVVKSDAIEQMKYTSWKIHNGLLVLPPDTFDISVLGADSLRLVKPDGSVFGLRRMPSGETDGRK